MKIAVLGGGNGSYAAVADMLEAGHDVIWWRRSAANRERWIAEWTEIVLR